jgi:hypothetical protein
MKTRIHIKHIIALLLIITSSSVAPVFAQSGAYGDNLTWRISNDTLYVEGTGTIPSGYSYGQPVWWYPHQSLIHVAIIRDDVTGIGSLAFLDCISLTSVIIGNGVTSIGYEAFSGCTNLTSVIFGNGVASIGEHAFFHCESLTSVIIGSGVTDIGSYAFNYCGLTSVVIPDGVRNIGENIFYDCKSLVSITIGRGLTNIGSWTFTGCSSLTSIDVADDNPNFSSENGVLFNKDKTTIIRCPLGKTGNYDIPGSVTSIDSDAFLFCNLTSITIGSNVTSIRSSAISGCWNLMSISVANDNPNFSSENGVLFNKNKTTIVRYPAGNAGSYDIPQSVTNIDSLAFSRCWNLISVTIPSGVTNIANSAFSDCTNLTSIIIPDGTANIGSHAFRNCKKLASVSIGNKVTSIGEVAFYGCWSLTSVTVPGSVTSLGDRAFMQCYLLASVNLGNSLTSIGEGAFYECYSLSSITIPGSVTSIGAYAFDGCTALNSVTVENGVLSIGKSAFAYCTGLPSITIPGSVTSIGIFAFSGCRALNSVTVEWTTPLALPAAIFSEVNVGNATLYVPAGTKTLYERAFEWKNFNIEESVTGLEHLQSQNISIFPNPASDFINITGAAGKNLAVYDSRGRRILNRKVVSDSETIPAGSWAKGIYFVRTGGNGNNSNVMKLVISK